MVNLRSGRTTGDDAGGKLNEVLKLPTGGKTLFYPMKVGEYLSPDGTTGHLAIVGNVTACIGYGKNLIGAADDASFKMDGYFEDGDFHDPSTFEDHPFHMERDLMLSGMYWRGAVTDCTLFIIVGKGKVVSFGWKKNGDDMWRVYEEPKLKSLD